MNQDALQSLRERIDELDAKILELLNERARIALEVARIKHDQNGPFYVPERERAILDRISALNQGPLPASSVRAIFREVMSATRSLEKPTRVGFLGPADTFSHMAALRVFGCSAEYHPLPSFVDIFTEVERGHVDYGVVPVESSMGGSVGEILDCFISFDLKIINEVMLRIAQNLLAKGSMDKIKRVYSKDNALLQCRNWLRANLPHAELIPTSSTAEAARRAAQEEDAAAIASALAAQTHGLTILAEHIEDRPQNYTRFLVLGKQWAKPTGNDKTALLLAVVDRPGALYQLLLPFAEAGINLTRIESRPSQERPWDYVFFLDFVGHVEDPQVAAVLEQISGCTKMLRILGSFPRARLED